MSQTVALRVDSVDIGVDISRVYAQVCHSASTWGYLKELPFPKFEELFEEYVTVFIDEKTQMTEGMINKELLSLKRDLEKEENAFTVETGFRPEHYGISKEAEFLNALLLTNFTFVLDGRLMNAPIEEVW